jgi:hypothetical protein
MIRITILFIIPHAPVTNHSAFVLTTLKLGGSWWVRWNNGRQKGLRELVLILQFSCFFRLCPCAKPCPDGGGVTHISDITQHSLANVSLEAEDQPQRVSHTHTPSPPQMSEEYFIRRLYSQTDRLIGICFLFINSLLHYTNHYKADNKRFNAIPLTIEKL